MKEQSVFHLISDLTKKEGVPCILIGGFAVNHYKVTRQTNDIDFLITKDDFQKILPVLREQGYQVMRQSEVFADLESSDRRLLDLDYMFILNNARTAQFLNG